MSGLTREERLLNGEALTPLTRREKILAKAGGADIETPTPVTREEMFLSAIKGGGGGSSGGGGASANKKEVNFYDYDGTILHSYTLNEAQALSELPELPTRNGLVCQGWNWTLEDIKAMGRAVDVGAMYITDDGATRIYIRLTEGRTSPMLGVCPNGTVTVDWGDGTAPDTLTGTSVKSDKWTPTHDYAKPGDYVISLFVEGSIGFVGSSNTNGGSCLLRYSSNNGESRNESYRNSVQRIELGNGVTNIGEYAFTRCTSLSSIVIPNGVTILGKNVFQYCYTLSSIVIPNGVTSIDDNSFASCYTLSSIVIPNGVTILGKNVFQYCYTLSSIVIPNGVTSIGEYAFMSCYTLSSIVIPNGVTSIGAYYLFSKCYTLSSVVIPNNVTLNNPKSAFIECMSLTSIKVPRSVTNIDTSMFGKCYGIKYYDFTNHTAVPELSSTTNLLVPADCEIRVPAALVDEWKAATNWSTYADKIVGV